MTFEDAYKLAHEIAGVFIDEEAAISQVKGSASIYDDDNPVCTLLGFAYSNMFSEEQQVEVKKIFTNPIREQTLKRVRSKMLAVTSVAGQSFAEQVTTNIIDSIVAIGEHSVAPRVSRKRLTALFKDYPCLWFCVIASTIYNNKCVLAASENAKKRPSPGTAQSTRNAAASLL